MINSIGDFSSSGVLSTPTLRDFPRINISPDRVIRTVVGLRPYRASGFRLGLDRLNEKLVIHNYGHGGGGVTLSWGTAKLAVEKVPPLHRGKVAVIGCGVVGLSTARLLQKRGMEVTIYTKDMPPNTTSNIAGALFGPSSVFARNSVDSEFMSQFDTALTHSYRMFQDYVEPRYGVSWIDNFFFGDREYFPEVNDIYPGLTRHTNPDIYFGKDVVHEYTTMLIEPAIYLRQLLRDFYLAGGQVQRRSFTNLFELVELEEQVIMNCTGLGARDLFSDEDLIPIKGQLSILVPQAEIDYCYVDPADDNLLYMFPRQDGIVLGGTSVKNDWSLEPDTNEIARILDGHAKINMSLR